MLNYKTISLNERTCICTICTGYCAIIHIHTENQATFGVLLFIQVIKEYTTTEKHTWPQTLPTVFLLNSNTCTSVLQFEDQQIKLNVNFFQGYKKEK